MTLAASAVLALAACGGDGGPGPTAGTGSTSTQAPTTTSKSTSTSASSTKAKSSSASPSTSSSSKPTDTGTPFDPKEFTSKIERAIHRNPTVTIDVKMGAQGQPGITATGVQDLKNEALEMELDLNGQKFTYRLVDGTYYLAQPPKWVAITKGSTNPLVKQALEQTSALSMRKQLDAFVAGVESAGDKGSEKVEGVTTTHYTATVRTADVRKELGLDPDPNAPARLIYDVWLDEDDLVRKMSFTQNGANATLIAKGWGDPVSIVKPKDSELAKVQ